jgi:hypothetical protein
MLVIDCLERKITLEIVALVSFLFCQEIAVRSLAWSSHLFSLYPLECIVCKYIHMISIREMERLFVERKGAYFLPI